MNQREGDTGVYAPDRAVETNGEELEKVFDVGPVALGKRLQQLHRTGLQALFGRCGLERGSQNRASMRLPWYVSRSSPQPS